VGNDGAKIQKISDMAKSNILLRGKTANSAQSAVQFLYQKKYIFLNFLNLFQYNFVYLQRNKTTEKDKKHTNLRSRVRSFKYFSYLCIEVIATFSYGKN